MEYKRTDRVGDLIRKEIASMLLGGDIKDPRIGMVTITIVKLSPDFRNATVYFSLFGTEQDKNRNVNGLNSATGYIRRRLAKSLKLKRIPTITFEFDDSIEYSSRIAEVLRDVN